MSKKIKHTAKGFLNAATKMLPGKGNLFQGSSSSASRREQLLQCANPEVRDMNIALQRTDEVIVFC